MGTACPGQCHGRHASTGCGAHWHMVPAHHRPVVSVSAMFMPTLPRFPPGSLHTMVTPARAAVLYAHFTAVHVRGEARGVTRGVTTCSCSGECYLVVRRSGDGDARQLSIETFITQFFNGCATQLTIAWRRKRFTFCQQIHYTEAETSFF